MVRSKYPKWRFMELKDLIKLQIEKGNQILENVYKMRECPTNVINMVAYVSEDIQNNRKAFNTMQYFILDI